MAVPKKKTSKSRRDKRRTHDALKMPVFAVCTKCGEVKRPHHICDNCGTYNDKPVIAVKE